MNKNHSVGLVAIAGIWLTAGSALPFVNILDMFSPEQLMVVRGFSTALIAFIGLRGAVKRVDNYTYLIALTLPLATLGLFQGIRHLGAGPTIIIVTATPVVQFILSIFLKRHISTAAIIGLILMLSGVTIARWGEILHWQGLAWAVFGTIMNGILYEWFARAKASTLQKCLYSSCGMGVLGLILSFNDSWAAVTDPKITTLLIGFALVGGILYWISNLIAFEKLPTNEASILAQGETPAVIIGAWLILGEKTSPIQWIGVFISLYGAWYLSSRLKKSVKQD